MSKKPEQQSDKLWFVEYKNAIGYDRNLYILGGSAQVAANKAKRIIKKLEGANYQIDSIKFKGTIDAF